MSDLIDRQTAIDAVLHHGEIENNYTDLYYDGYCDGVYDSADMLKDLPSAQPTQNNYFNTLDALDCVSRQAAIDAVFGRSHEIIKMRIGNLPSAEPRCYLGSPCEYQNPGIKIPMQTADPKTGR